MDFAAEDVVTHHDHSVEVITAPELFLLIKDALMKAGFQPEEADMTMRAATNVSITDKETAEKVVNLIDVLEDLDDVQLVYSNADIAEDILNEL